MRTGRIRPLVALTAVTAAVAGCGDEYQRGAGIYTTTLTTTAAQTTTTTTATTGATTTTAAAPAQSTSAGAPESSEAPPRTPAQQRVVRAASAQARVFMRGYLPYSYGRARAANIRAVAPALRRELAANPPRVPPALAAKARPQIAKITVSGIDDSHVTLLIKVKDASSSYATLVTLTRPGSRWVVSEVR